MIHGKNIFDQPVKKDFITYENIQQIATSQDDCTTACLLEYNSFKNCYKMIAKDVSKQQTLDSDPKTILQINFTGNLAWVRNTTMFFIIE